MNDVLVSMSATLHASSKSSSSKRRWADAETATSLEVDDIVANALEEEGMNDGGHEDDDDEDGACCHEVAGLE